ncbi:MAG: cupin domain-containing protein [Sphingomonas oligoaromativorans]|jgi:predicted cupin superfamily sugar epimerase
MHSAQAIIERLNLQPHPEGGWYRETWRAEAEPGARAGATAIYFLLEAGQRSHWHRVDAAELWLWHAGAPLRLLTAPSESGPVTEHRLGPDIASGEAPQGLVPPHHWQSTETTGGWALVSCIVAPGFDFAGFTLAPAGWAPGAP